MKSMYRDFGKSLIDPKYCCCAIPVVNFGIYSILLEQGVVALAIGVMIFSTPSVVGAYFPSFAGIILAICCFVVAGLQPVGFVGVLREKTSTYRWYSLLNMLAVLSSFAAAAGLIISSATKHAPAIGKCRTDFFTPSSALTGITAGAANATLSAQADTLCPAFAWADVGIMGGLWLILLVTQGYFIFVTRKYGKSQVSDHKLYHSVYSENPEAFTMSVLRSTRYNPGSVYNTQPPIPGHKDDIWDHRISTESLRDDKVYQDQHEAYPQHYRGESSGGMLPPDGQGGVHGGGGGNRESRYEDAHDERYGYDQQQHYGEGHGQTQYGFAAGQGQGQGQGQGYGGGGGGYAR